MANNIVAPNEYKTVWLDRALQGGSAESLSLRCYSNDVTPDEDSTLADFTICDFIGYANQTLVSSDWDASTIIDDEAVTVHADEPFAFERTSTGSPQTIYGWLLVGATSGLVALASRLDTPRVMASAGDTTEITITAKLAQLA